MPKYIVTIGLEVHAQLTTQSKMFCGCPVEVGAEPNSNTCPTCLGLPGALPVLNEAAIEKTILTGMMLGCSTPPVVSWDRKNYFYPDMPKNYQITQMPFPLCLGGGVPLYDVAYPKDAQKSIANPGKVVQLTRIHLEEDVGKSTHHDKFTSLDFNRAGTPLMEIVSEPDIDSAEEAVAYLNSLRQILIYGGVSDADMEKGQMRADVNISVRPEGQKELGVKIELKNINSMSAIRRAIKAETERQIDVLEGRNPEKLVQSTRRWDDDRGETTPMRTKEDAHDYRYFPDPDLIPLRTEKIVERVRPLVPELPHEKRARFESDYGCSPYDAGVLVSDKFLADYYEAAVGADTKVPAKKIANWVINDLLGLLKDTEDGIKACPVKPEILSELVAIVESGKISNNQAKEVFAEMFATGQSAAPIIKAKGFEQVSDTGALEAIVEQILAANPEKVAEVKGGNEKAMNWFTGQAMKASQGKANPKIVTEIVRKKLLS
ncbi:aspartyl/glutamyl-tRNA(Asn/Gln) amidotransferase subunit B [Prosthecobacter debontii]|uniref:Aspartyl/glutamyl-tRNA(Asn/Gln) amidotransferase subunit B n=1 Tax=Prosthecobacter debontii TaxID=48467 RepID=A0A1T4YD96_9BACT|nr:Asp-tRNA(Asn)/Glu-tRNA(Gln) amidotransferase subunit GatB [Prosthecobacter debontii]SKA99759.1 aspartyl/glutamyl-tRNA(Asn/Gln) amidotransferase subunit B [Prosthecobacter debontii]